MAFRLSIAGLGVALAGLVAGCATQVHEERLPWIDGWRKATVVAIGAGDDIARTLAENCSSALPLITPNANYVTVSFRNGGHRLRRTVPWTGTLAVGVGDRVYVNVSDCAKPLERVVTDDS